MKPAHMPASEPLLGRLARHNWFRQHGEYAATSALGILLEQQALRDGLITLLEQVTNLQLGPISNFKNEVILDDNSRPDLEGYDSQQLPRIVIEAKFDAELTTEQIEGYAASQIKRTNGTPSVLAILVPTSRLNHANTVIENVSNTLTADNVRLVPITWTQIVEALHQTAHNNNVEQSISSDIEQFEALCLTLSGQSIQAFGNIAEGESWESRRDDIEYVIRQTLKNFDDENDNFPFGNEPHYQVRRYFRGVDAQIASGQDTACALGVGTQFHKTHRTLLWARYHRKTPAFSIVKSRLEQSPYRDRLEHFEGHLWIPIPIDPTATGPQLFIDLESQISDLVRHASKN